MRNVSFQKLVVATLAFCMLGICRTAEAQQTQITNTGNPDGKLGALSRRPSANKVETETADDFFLRQATVLTGAIITGLLTDGAKLENIQNVEVEVYHIFPLDSVDRGSASGVPSRMNSPSDVEIDSATRALTDRTLLIQGRVLNTNFSALNTVINRINKKPLNTTHGEGPVTGQQVELAITFTNPILLPEGHYFFRPEVLVSGGDFLYLSTPRPIAAPGTPFVGDLQAWIRNSDLSPDWLRIGTDIIGTDVPGGIPPTFNMAFSLTGTTIQAPGTPGEPNCHGQSVSGLTEQFGSLAAAASALGFANPAALHDSFRTFCER